MKKEIKDSFSSSAAFTMMSILTATLGVLIFDSVFIAILILPGLAFCLDTYRRYYKILKRANLLSRYWIFVLFYINTVCLIKTISNLTLDQSLSWSVGILSIIILSKSFNSVPNEQEQENI